MVYRQSEDAPKEAAKIAEEHNVKCEAYKVDQSDAQAMRDLVHKVYTDLGPVGGIVLNAGIAVAKPALELTKEDYQTQFDTNYWGVLAGCQAVAGLWKEHGYQNGRIVIISSISAKVANKGAQQCLYNSSKGAVSMLAKCLAMEWADMGVSVNCINPGVVETDMTEGMRNSDEKVEKLKQMMPLARASQPDEQAGMAVFLLSDRSSCEFAKKHVWGDSIS